MSMDNRCKDRLWEIRDGRYAYQDGQDCYHPDLAKLAVLMDIRDELKQLNSLLRRDGPDALEKLLGL